MTSTPDAAASIAFALVAHTNAGKTTLARTLLGRDIGEVRDAPHVTEFVETHELLRSAAGDRLLLADTPGFGDSAKLAARMRLAGNPIGWLLSQAWDRWRDRAFWGTQQALRHVRDGPLGAAPGGAELLLYLVNASEGAPAQAEQLRAEFELLRWVGAPVLVLLNQLGAPRPVADEAAEVEAWRKALAGLGVAHEVLPLDAFARCWIQEAALWQAALGLLPGARQPALRRLQQAWAAHHDRRFDASIVALARALAAVGGERVELAAPETWQQRLRQLGQAGGRADEAERAGQALQQTLAATLRRLTGELLELHQIEAGAAPQIHERVAAQGQLHLRLPEARTALWSGLVSGALAGLKADLASGGLTMGGGALLGGVLGALGGAGIVRGLNRLRGTEASWARWPDEALPALARDLLLRYLAVAHFGRGRGQWSEGEAPPHWAAVADAQLAPLMPALTAAWRSADSRASDEGPARTDTAPASAALQPLLRRAVADTLAALYPACQAPSRGEAPS